jgi:hypothetical protein
MNRLKSGRGHTLLGLSAALALLASACTMAHIGSVRGSREAARAFEDLQGNPGYRYWYLNQENSPYGVAGIEREYRIEGFLWQAVDPGSPVFRKVVGLVRDFPAAGGLTSGFEIRDPQGRVIGVWYSSLSAGITVDPEAKVVSIATGWPWVGPRGP